MKLVRFGLFLGCLLWLVPGVVGAVDLPEPRGYVNDFAQVLSAEFENELDQKLTDYAKATTNEISVITIESLEELTIEEYGIKLATKWGVGQKGKDNGLLLLLAPNEKKVRIEIGYGLEGLLTDGQSGYILDTKFIPEYRKGNLDEAILKTINEIQTELGETGQENMATNTSNSSDVPTYLPILIIFLIYLAAFMSRSKEFVTGGVVGFFGGLVINGLVAGMVMGVIGLILDFILSQNYKETRSRGLPTNFGSTWGGFKTGGFSGGSSGGGFGSFGGGKFGGGGSSRSL